MTGGGGAGVAAPNGPAGGPKGIGGANMLWLGVGGCGCRGLILGAPGRLE